MNTNASMFDRLFAVFLDLLTFIGCACGLLMVLMDESEIANVFNHELRIRDNLIKTLIIAVVIYFVLDIFLTRIFATTPGKLSMNCDVDFHMGNSMIYCIIRSFFKVICLFTVILGLASYIFASNNIDSRSFHDLIAKTNVTNTTRIPRVVGVLVVLLGISLLVVFVVRYHSILGINPSLGLSNFKIFEF